MQLIRCPWCGPREETEFCFGGQAHVAYPTEPAALTDEQWAAFVFVRANPKGLAAERWRHAAACGRWFNVVRDTRTYEFHATYPIGKPAPPDLGERSDGGMALGAHTLVTTADRTAVTR